jgi:predicted phosphodiesterase
VARLCVYIAGDAVRIVVRTLIVSDLHLGSASRADLLRVPEFQVPLFDALREADRLVLLGDLLELRDGPSHEAMNAARPFFEELGREFSGREVVIVAGNHDHALVTPWLARRGELGEADPLGLEQRLAVSASPMLATLAQWAEPVRLSASYPGVWLRDDVYATHGHYLDCHAGVTSGERLMITVARRIPGSVDDYESVTGPVYARLDAFAILRRLAYSRTAARLGRLLTGLRGDELVRAERRAMGEAAARLELGDAYVVFGHTHRAGPFSGEDELQWRGRLGARLINCGCWLGDVAVSDFGRGRAACFSGSCVVVEDSGPPAVVLLHGRVSAASQGSTRAD